MTKSPYVTGEMAGCNGNLSKVERYGWILKDLPGQFAQLEKGLLNVDHAYQREKVVVKKIRQIASEWSWVGCGCILVAQRPDGTFWVFDGQHRVLASRNRSDIRDLPCMVFQCAEKTQEAAGFLVANSERKPVSALDKFRALVMTGDTTAAVVSEVFERLGVAVDANPTSAGQIKCIAKCLQLAANNAEGFEWAMQATLNVCGDQPVHSDILSGLFWIEHTHGLCGTKRFERRLAMASRSDILESISRFAAAEGKRGERVCGRAILKVLNKGLRDKFGAHEESE